MSFAKDLRASVLQAAMQGKLTEQLETDTPVSELLADIKAEKDRLIAEKKIKKEKPLSAISEEDIPFDIPENWEFRRLCKLSVITSGGTPSRSNHKYWNGNIPWVKIGDMKDKYLNETEETISEEGLNNSSAKYFEKGTILYSIFASIGTVSILNIKATTNQAIAGITALGGIDNDYLYYVLVALKDILVKKGRGCAQSNINQEILKNTPIPLPPIEEQKRIVRRIEEIMKHIDELEAIEEELKKLKEAFPTNMKAAILQAAMQGKLTEQLDTDGSVNELLENIKTERERMVKEGKVKKNKMIQNNNFVALEDAPFDIPSSWKWVKIENLGATNDTSSFCDGPFGSNLKTEHQISLPEVRIIQLSNIGENGWKDKNTKYTSFKHLEEVIPCCEVYPGDFVIAKMMPAGRTIEVPNLNTRITLGSDAMKFVPSKFLNKQYLLYAMRSQTFLNQVYSGVKGVTRVRTTLKNIKSYILPIPPIEEQQRIVDKLKIILPLIEDV